MYRLLTLLCLFAFATPAFSQSVADSIRADWNEIGVRLARIVDLMDQVGGDSIRVDTVEIVRIDTVETIRIDTVFVPRAPVVRPIPDRSTLNLVESRFFADSTGYEIYIQGIDTLVAIYDDRSMWYATHGDFVSYQLHSGSEVVTVPRVYWNMTADDDLHLDITSIKSVTESVLTRDDPSLEEPAAVEWELGDDLDLGPLVLEDSFRVEASIIPDSFTSWMRVVGKSGGPSPVHWWIIEVSPLRDVWLRVRVNNQTVAASVGGLVAGEEATIEAEYTGSEIVLTVNGQSVSSPAVGTRDETTDYHVWVWEEGAPDPRTFNGEIQYVRIYP